MPSIPRSSSIPNLVGHTIDDGRLKFTRVLGHGSNGVVFLAVDTTSPVESPAQYAVKCVVKADKRSRHYDLQRVEIANHMRASSHPNVLTLHCVIEDCFFIFLVLDYCAGGDLFQFLAGGGIARGNNALVKRIFLQIVDAVDACHNLGIFHRDVKPENIMCSADGTRVYLGDFGLSTRRSYSITFGAGSSFYMSPECLGADPTAETYSTRANDVWALGVILTAMVSGHNPWRHATYTDDCYRTYMYDKDFLRKTLPISIAANRLLQKIFTRDSARISVPRLRVMVRQVDTFFVADKCSAVGFHSRHSTRGRVRSQEQHINAEEVFVEEKWTDIADEVDITEKSVHTTFLSLGMEVCVAPRSSGDAFHGDTSSGVESIGPPTPEPSLVMRSSPGQSRFDTQGAVKPIGSRRMALGGKMRITMSSGFFKRMAERLYLC